MIAVMGVIVFFFLPSDPSEVDATPPQHHLPDNRNKHVSGFLHKISV
jgi:hypothetical protein